MIEKKVFLSYNYWESSIYGDDDRNCAMANREPCQMGNQAAISGACDVCGFSGRSLYVYTAAKTIWEDLRNGVSGNLPKMASGCF